MNQYDLSNIDTVVGNFQVKLYSTIAGLTVPTNNTILEVGDLEQTADINIGISQIGTLSLKLKDDYSTYTEGFWYKVLASECWLRLYLVEDGITTFYFFGLPQEESVEWTEYYVDSTYIRTCSLNLVSMAYKLLDTPTEDWIIEVINNSINTGAELDNGPSYRISAKGLFSAMLKASALNVTYSETDTSFVYGTVDFRYTIGAYNHTFDTLSIAVKYFVVPATQVTAEYWAGSNKLSTKFATLRDLLRHLLANFGVMMVMDYDTGTERHLIKLVQRGRAYADAARLTFGSREKKSTISKSFDLLGDATRATQLLDTTAFVWFSKKYLNGKSTAEVPNYVEFDADLQCIFRIGNDNTGYAVSRSLWNVSGTSWALIGGIDYWNYAISAYVTADSSAYKGMQEAMAGYVYHRFTNKFTMIRRVYGQIKAHNGTTNSHANAAIMQRSSINDGTGAANFYANKVRKSVATGELEIEWIKE